MQIQANVELEPASAPSAGSPPTPQRCPLVPSSPPPSCPRPRLLISGVQETRPRLAAGEVGGAPEGAGAKEIATIFLRRG